VSQVFHEFALPEGRLRQHGMKVDPAAITDTGLLTIEAENDDISGAGQTRVAHALCGGLSSVRQAHHVQPGIGHFGLFHGRVCRTAILPRIRSFVRTGGRS
jgi:poly(3-hydroxybutyrate) depolymerase